MASPGGQRTTSDDPLVRHLMKILQNPKRRSIGKKWSPEIAIKIGYLLSGKKQRRIFRSLGRFGLKRAKGLNDLPVASSLLDFWSGREVDFYQEYLDLLELPACSACRRSPWQERKQPARRSKDINMSLHQPDPAKPGRGLLRLFAASWSLFLGAGAYFACSRFPHSPAWLWLMGAAGLFSVGLLFPAAMKPLFVLVERMLRPVGEAVSTVLFAAVYFSVFTFFALGMRLFGCDALRLKRSNWGPSAWQKKSAEVRHFGYFGQY